LGNHLTKFGYPLIIDSNVYLVKDDLRIKSALLTIIGINLPLLFRLIGVITILNRRKLERPQAFGYIMPSDLRPQAERHAMLLLLDGPAALSDFRRRALLQKCRRHVPQLDGMEARFFYMVHLDDSPSATQRRRLEDILPLAGPFNADSAAVLIAPRQGTISPWSSKATDIMRNCSIDGIIRVERGTAYSFNAPPGLDLSPLYPSLYDRMTHAVVEDPASLFVQVEPPPLARLPLQERGRAALEEANASMGLALAAGEIDYFQAAFAGLDRDPTDVELMMFSVVNSEHCRHKIFNAGWKVDGRERPLSLFDMIRHTHARHPQGCVSAYADNAGVIAGFAAPVFRPQAAAGQTYGYDDKQTHIVIKVETHNHPTAISPYPGASTGVGGEIRDEGATGIGGHSQAGLCAFFTSHLRLPNLPRPWEKDHAEFPHRLSSPLEIMSEGPIGGAAFGNEFGRPNILGVFRTFEDQVHGRYRAYHKPIMVAGGIGLIDAEHVDKKTPTKGDYVIQLGGPAMLIGLGGGAASSMDTGSNLEELDFASVQRDNPEMQRRCQELLNRCIGLGPNNPILSIHDIGAGGLSNGCPELVEATGARFELRAVHNDDPGMSPMQIWCNEAQERYVLVVGRDDLERFSAIADRERCLYAVIGEISGDSKLHLHDEHFGDDPIDGLDLGILLGKPPRMQRDVEHLPETKTPLDLSGITLAEAAQRVLGFPAVASKTFLVSIADRSVTGLIARDQMVGPYQTPLADLAVTATSFKKHTGSAMSMGERTPLALLDAPTSGRMAIAEAVTNIAAAHIGPVGNIKLSANWMCACGEAGEDALLYDTVEAVGMEFCPALGVAIPVGKDSLSMRAVWDDSQGASHKAVAPLSLVISAFAPVRDIRRTLTPDLKAEEDTVLLLVDLGHGQNRLGGSVLAQVHNQMGDTPPDIDPIDLGKLYAAVQDLLSRDLLLAYHDRSDGGLFACVAEMAFGGRRGVEIDISALGPDPLAALFNEEIGVVLQSRAGRGEAVEDILVRHGLKACTHRIGTPTDSVDLEINHNSQTVFAAPVHQLLQTWSEMTYHMQAQRDNPECAREEFDTLADTADPGLSFAADFDFLFDSGEGIATAPRPRVAVLREQGVNGQVEMAAAFDAAGFEAVDVPMTDLLAGRTDLAAFSGLVACGGFSYGDVLGAGAGWAKTVLFNEDLRQMFGAFFARPDTFGLGVCNGCQMLSHLKELIPGAENWPAFVRNRSEQFEARYATVEILESKSVFLSGMAGARLGIAVAHGEGRVEFAGENGLAQTQADGQHAMRYVDNYGKATSTYPSNPNGSPDGLTALCNADGRFTIMMPHPERVFRTAQLSWKPADWVGEYSPWIRMFRNAHDFVTKR
jgi:phosphoribosylformylglycinamidine synthase